MSQPKRKYTIDIERLRRTQGCLTDSVAYYLNIHPEYVPYFVYPKKDWVVRLKTFFKEHGYNVWWTLCDTVPNQGMHIVCGDSLRWKTYTHVVVYRDGKLAYDPQYPSKWKDSRITHILIIEKINYE